MNFKDAKLELIDSKITFALGSKIERSLSKLWSTLAEPRGLPAVLSKTFYTECFNEKKNPDNYLLANLSFDLFQFQKRQAKIIWNLVCIFVFLFYLNIWILFQQLNKLSISMNEFSVKIRKPQEICTYLCWLPD